MKTILKTVATAVGVGFVLAGCASSNIEDVKYTSIRSDLTPELRNLAERPIDVDSHYYYTENVNKRMILMDLGRTWYTDHPSRLSPYPIVDLSGQPR